MRPLTSDNDWRLATESQIAGRDREDFSESEYRPFKEAQMGDYRRMQAAGLGHWYGAFIGADLVADLGIYRDERVARFQAVETRFEHRRRGICGTLIYRAARHFDDRFGIDTYVIVADPDALAARVYKSVGFELTERQFSLYRYREET